MIRNVDIIRGGLAEVWETQGRKFVTFETAGRTGDADGPWVQYLDGELNVEWTSDDEPAVLLARRGVTLPAGAFVSWFAAGSNAVFGVGDARIDETARFIDALFVRVLHGESGAPLVARIDSHG